MIYMAAGNSRRFGSNKLFYELDGKPMYRHLLERLAGICGRHEGWRVFVVSQYEELLDGVKEVAETMPSGRKNDITGVFCEASRNGASYTVRAGLSAACRAQEASAAYVFFAADQPYLTEQTAEDFLMFMEQSGVGLGCVSHNGETGNPVWFSELYVPELMALTGDRGGKKVVKAHMDQAVFFEVRDPKELEDLDLAPVSEIRENFTDIKL